LAEVKAQIGQGSEGNPVQCINDGIKIIDDKKMDVLILPSDSGRGDKPRPKLDTNTPSFSEKDGEWLDEWLFVMNTAFESLNVRDGKVRLNMVTVYVKEGPLKALMAYTRNSVKPEWNGFQDILRSQFSHRGFFRDLMNWQVQLKNMSESKLTELIDGLKEEYNYAVLTAHCDSLVKAVDMACSLDICMNNGEQIEVNSVKNVNFFKKYNNRRSGYESQEPLERDSS
jgi:hypothetical protein